MPQEADTHCPSLGGGRGNCISGGFAAPHWLVAVLLSPSEFRGLLMPQQTTARPMCVSTFPPRLQG